MFNRSLERTESPKVIFFSEALEIVKKKSNFITCFNVNKCGYKLLNVLSNFVDFGRIGKQYGQLSPTFSRPPILPKMPFNTRKVFLFNQKFSDFLHEILQLKWKRQFRNIIY